jgi:hypothetical protein
LALVMTDTQSLGKQLAALRWANKTEAERKAHSKMMTAALLRKMKKSATTLRAQGPKRRSRKPQSHKPKSS